MWPAFFLRCRLINDRGSRKNRIIQGRPLHLCPLALGR